MKKYLTLFICLCVISVSYAQVSKSAARKAEKEARKEAAAAEQKAAGLKAQKALVAQDFVVEADRVEFRVGMPEFVNPSTNFVSLKGNTATIQLTSNSSRQGVNGMGGITVEGRATNIKSSLNNKGDVNFSMMVQGKGVSARVDITLTSGSDKCQAEVTGNFSGGKITFTGRLYPTEESSMFKGRTL